MNPKYVEELGVSILLFVMGWIIWKKQALWLIHSYHCKRVKEEDRAAYSKRVGIVLISIGVGALIQAAFDCFVSQSQMPIILIVVLVVSFIYLHFVQKKYNGGWF